MSESTYAGSVRVFEALLSEAADTRHATPASLIRAAALPPSSGYRYVNALEAEGFLRRDQGRRYVQGRLAARTGMHAFGIGKIAPATEAIVTRMRQITRHSAFVGILLDGTLHVGAHSHGRSARLLRTLPQYSCEGVPDLAQESCVEVALTHAEDGIARRVSALVTALPMPEAAGVVLGLVLDRDRSDTSDLIAALDEARSRMARVWEAAQ